MQSKGIEVPPAQKPEHSQVPTLKPAVGQKIALHALPAARKATP